MIVGVTSGSNLRYVPLGMAAWMDVLGAAVTPYMGFATPVATDGGGGAGAVPYKGLATPPAVGGAMRAVPYALSPAAPADA